MCVCDYMDQNVCVAREYCATCNVSHDTGVEGRQSKPRYSTQNTHTQQERERNVEGQKARGTRRERERAVSKERKRMNKTGSERGREMFRGARVTVNTGKDGIENFSGD